LVRKYRDPPVLRSSIPRGEGLSNLPRLPFIGELDYRGLIHMLEENRRWLSRSERQLVEQLTDYLYFKLAYYRKMNPPNR
jgi:hypothetical protein